MNGADSPKVRCGGRESHTLLRGTASQELSGGQPSAREGVAAGGLRKRENRTLRGPLHLRSRRR